VDRYERIRQWLLPHIWTTVNTQLES
jgi:hypothetical protein